MVVGGGGQGWWLELVDGLQSWLLVAVARGDKRRAMIVNANTVQWR